MFNIKLNRQFFRSQPELADGVFIGLFGVLWAALFYALTLTTAVYGSLNSRSLSFDSIWTENILLIATLGQGLLLFFFRDQLKTRLQFSTQDRILFFASAIRGFLFGGMLLLGLIFLGQYEFLGFKAKGGLNFFAAYGWWLRIVLLFFWVLSIQVFTHSIVIPQIRLIKHPLFRRGFGVMIALFIYSIWFDFSFREALTLAMLEVLFFSLWESTGFISALFTLAHPLFSLRWMGNDFNGLAQLREVPAALMISGGSADLPEPHSFFELPVLQFCLLLFWIAFRGLPTYNQFRINQQEKQT